jgi:bla regulator protein blaR1
MINGLSMLAAHLWQSTLFGVVLGLLTLLLRKNPARTRYWVWLTALMKFLVPFGMLVSLGGHLSMLGWQPKAPLMVQPAISFVMGDLNESALPVLKEALPTPQPTNSRLPAVWFGVWACGFVSITFRWMRRWTRVRADVQAARTLPIEIGIPVVSSPILREPGVFGVFRPVLLLPEGMAEQLNKGEWEAILAHELCHARCYDNLTAAIYMLVETIFWFHPLVWWMGKRLVVEREFACDEEVLRLGSEPKVYAEGILKVCELYLESPLECVAGVTGSNLRRRLRAIITHRGTERMNMGKKLLLATVGASAVVGPILVGLLNAPPSRAQSQDSEHPRFEVASVRRNISGAANRGSRVTPGGLSIGNMTLKDVVMWAYRIREFQLSGGPGWINSDQYDIEAKPPRNTDPQQQILMLQTLLHDRFSLELHRETKILPVYELTVAKGGIKLKEEGNCISLEPGKELEQGQKISETCGYNMLGRGRFDATSTSMVDLANYLFPVLGRQVVDKTGVSGRFPVHLTFIPDVAAVPDDTRNPDGPSIFTAVQEQLGLKLDSAKGPVDVLVIDHVERPSEN